LEKQQFCIFLFCGWGCANISLQNTGHSGANILIGFSLSAPHSRHNEIKGRRSGRRKIRKVSVSNYPGWAL
jgi:hypothetical protein